MTFAPKTYSLCLVWVFLGVIFLANSCINSGPGSIDKPESDKIQEKTFDESKWKTKENLDFPFRNEMLKELMTNPSYRKYKKEELQSLLGTPDRIDCNYLFYTIEQKRIGLWPLHTKTLVIKFFDNDSIQWMKIHE